MNVKNDLSGVTGTAVILTSGSFKSIDEKTGHGLIDAISSGGSYGRVRFQILGVIENIYLDQDAGTVKFNRPVGVRIYPSIQSMLDAGVPRPDYAVVGSATPGGRLREPLLAQVKEALKLGVSVVNGMHEPLSSRKELVQLANLTGAQIIDFRVVLPEMSLHAWDPQILDITAECIPIMGTDAALGKRTLMRRLLAAAQAIGRKAAPIYTGPTGALQCHPDDYNGFQFDCTADDRTGGELAHFALEAVRKFQPKLIFAEGQGSFFFPSAPCGAEYLTALNAKRVILQHAPRREAYDGFENLLAAGHELFRIRPEGDVIKLIELYGADVVAICLNSQGMSDQQLEATKQNMHAELGIPIYNPLVEEDMIRLVESL